MKKKESLPQDAFMREVEEDLKNESMRKIWDKYGLYVIALVVVSLTLAVSFEGVKAWYLSKFEQRSNQFAYALNLQNQQKLDESIEVFENIIEKDEGIFASLAILQKAEALVEQNKNSEAEDVLAKMAKDDGAVGQLREIAILKLASYKLDTAPAEEISSLLQPILQNPENSWFAVARDMMASVALRDGKNEQAVEIYNQLLQTPSTPETIKSKARSILSVL